MAGQAAHQAGKTNTLSLGAFLISVEMEETTAVFFQFDLLHLCSGHGHIKWDPDSRTQCDQKIWDGVGEHPIMLKGLNLRLDKG